VRNASIFVIILVSIILGAATLTRGHEWGDDFASYIMQAGSILNGTTPEFIQHNSLTIFESSNQIGPIAYPWGYPLILTPVYAIEGIHPLALKLPGLFFFAGFLICLYLLFKNRLERTESLLLVALFAFNPLLIRFLDQILSDIPFLFFSTLALWLITKEKQNIIHFVLIGATIFFAFFIRTTGILLLASLLTLEIFRAWSKRADRKFIQRSIRNLLIACMTFGSLWLLSILIFPDGGESYLAQYQNFKIGNAFGFIYSYFQVFSLFFGDSFIWQILYFVVFVFFLIGVWIKRKDQTFFIIFFSLWMLLLITWPFWQGPRFIFPLLPLLIYFAFQGMKFLLEKLPENYTQLGRSIFYSFWLLIIGVFLFNSAANAYGNLRNDRAINGPFDSYSQEVYTYIKEKTPSASVVVFFKPRAMRLMTDHDTLMSTECDRILKGDYLVLSRKVGKNQQIPPEEIEACHLPLDQVLKNSRFIVYQIQK
jgi:4-amino-4-deoxy-L-arabinose transferase-like glycosyltransferase